MGGRIGGAAPDVFDPPTSPNHRSLGHGILPVAGASVTVLDQMDSWQESCRAFARRQVALGNNAEKGDEVIWRLFMEFLGHVGAGMVVGIAAGYVSHLAMDATTKRGLPLVG